MTDLIADMPRDERPRERMIMHGTHTLSDAELLALLLGSGIRGKSAVHLARELLVDGFRLLGRRDLTELARIRGVGTAKASRIAAAFEISRRMHNRSTETDESVKFNIETFAEELIQTHQFHQEHVGAALLDPHSKLLKRQTIFIGTINNAYVSPRDIVKYAVLNNAAAVVVYHNHPSGNPKPSAHDVDFTRKVRDALELFDIEMTDHLIVGGDTFVSMRKKCAI